MPIIVLRTAAAGVLLARRREALSNCRINIVLCQVKTQFQAMLIVATRCARQVLVHVGESLLQSDFFSKLSAE